ncbi:G patch domain-containing protein 2-like [Amphiura filiformis]|uniref:G patch domain-containing protein 2-like n=1 Tax=Amphiura filiformis TaxID=82378 RepID=UPI003B21D0E3
MDELPQALAQALEETSPLLELDNDCQTSAFNSPKLTRRQSRKRRGRKRRADPNPIWENSIKFSDGSDTSLDEALKDYMENVTKTQAQYQGDSASDDAMMVKRLSSLNVTSSSNLYGESDSVTETHTILKRPHRKKKRFKRMAVDAAAPSAIPDFIQEGRQKRPKKSRKKKTDDDDIENSQNVKGKFGFDITTVKKNLGKSGKPPVPLPVRRKDSSPQSPGSSGSHRDSNPQSPLVVTEEGVMDDLSKKGACCSPDSLDDGRKHSGSDGASETTLGGRAMECCTSNESDVTMEATPKGGNETSSLSSSSEEDGGYTNDEGREGDDEQSDFFLEPGGGAVCGIPGVIPWWEKNSMPLEDERFTSIITGTFSLLSRGSQRSFQSRLRGLQNMDDVQVRGCRQRMKAKQRLKKSSLSVVNDKIVRFMKNPHERELLLQPMKKQQHTQLGQLASLYSLDIRTEGSGRKRSPVLIKTRDSRPLIPMDIERWSSSKYSMQDSVMSTQSHYPQFADAKRRRKTPPPTVPLEGLVGPDKPIPDNNIGNRMLQSMGWSPGTGLGPGGSGIQEPVKAYIRPKNRGLGHWKPAFGQP